MTEKDEFADMLREAKGGITLRDYFAAHALEGFVVRGIPKDLDYTAIGKASYLLADSMLAEGRITPVMYQGNARETIRFLLSRLDLAEKVVAAARKAICDSFSGMNCEEDCANKILPKALAEWDKREKE